jgi:tRNA pseudouridine55 synthase
MSALRRVRAGEFSIDNAHTLDEIRQASEEGEAESLLLPVDSLFREYPSLSVDARGELRIRCGSSIATLAEEGDYRIYGPDGAFLSLARVSGGELTCIKRFFEV